MTKNILGLDLGTNSIGWALIQQDFENKNGKILGMGSRIIPMDQKILGDFDSGNSVSQTAERTKYRGTRRLRERHLLRRERLHRVLHIFNFLPFHYSNQIDFKKRFGKFIPDHEPKLAYSKDGFLFKNSFEEMLSKFRKTQPLFLKNKNGEDALIPYDWTIYYLRKKALKEKIKKEELAWIILNFNQKRGYYQLRGEEEENTSNKLIEFHSLKIIDIIPDEEVNKKGEIWYSIHLENGWIYRRASKIPLFDWKNKTRDFIVTTDLNDDGTEKLDKEGNIKRSFRAPNADDWTLLKKKTEQEIENSHKTVGEYIFKNLLLNPKQKIKGKLVRTIERKFYKDELKAILEKQAEFHPEFTDKNLFSDAVSELYRNNEKHQLLLESKDFVHLILEDILFYQRPLKSKKSTISNCSLECRKSKEGIVYPIKVISKSNPYYQEFRLLQWLKNLNIYRTEDGVNVTTEFIESSEDRFALLVFLKSKKEIEQNQLITFLLQRKLGIKKTPKTELEKYRWNYVENKKYPCYETRNLIQNKLNKVDNIKSDFLTFEKELALWHIIYSVNDKIEYEKALKKFAEKNKINVDSFFDAFKKFPPFKNDYGSFSEKAIRKLLPLMRFGTDYSYENLTPEIKEKINNIITGEFDEGISNKVREKVEKEKEKLKTETDFQELPLWLAQYIVYGRHSETDISGKWNSVSDIEKYLEEFKQHTLRNPIVEQVVTETLRVVKDIWSFYGKGVKDFFSEIHIELGRDLKNTKEERSRLTQTVSANENTNLRIKYLLAELALDSDVKNVIPYSPSQQEILKIYEDGALNSVKEIDEDILKISKTAQPSSSDLKKYKLWLEQKYRSPYTGQIIPLNKLFTPEYEIEHIIPQSRYFDDSFSNKVICEAEVNKLKDRQLGLEFIKNHHGYKISDNLQILEIDAYESFVKQSYSKNYKKRINLLLEDIPEKMILRQLNDTRYISKHISHLLSNIVRDEKKENYDDGYNSKNVVPGNGKITARLKQDWGLNDVWNELILPRFERMNQLTNSTDFTTWNEKYQKFLPTVPLEFSKGFSKKRIDHRHHALDALVIACATRSHINLLSNESAKSDIKRYDLQVKLRNTETYYNDKEKKEKTRFTTFKKPWKTFTQDARTSLESIVVSFKQNTRIINKATNYYEKWGEKDGKKTKVYVKQEGTNWAIRKPLHKEFIYGNVHLNWKKTPKGKITTAIRKNLDSSFNEKTIESITDTGIQKILLNYLQAKENKPEIAFSPEGIEELNQNIRLYNDNKNHQPIIKVRVFEQGSKFALGESGNKQEKFVETAKGTNLFFGIYEGKNGKRSYDTIALNNVIERQKQGLSSVPEINEKGEKLLFNLSPNDLVYIPEENDNFDLKYININNIYKMVSCTGGECHFVPNRYAFPIQKNECGTNNKSERVMIFFNNNDLFGNDKKALMIKEHCIKLKIDRLGNISKI